MTQYVPVIDIGPFLHGSPKEKKTVAKEVDYAFTHCGFMTVSGHGVDPALLNRMKQVTTSFFEFSEEEKEKVKSLPKKNLFGGWVPFAADTAARLLDDNPPPDLRERYRAGCNENNPEVLAYTGVDQWPEEPADFAKSWQAYYVQMERLVNAIIRACSLALGMPEDGLNSYFEHHFSVLMAAFSPAMPVPDDPAQLRCGAHTDIGTLTLVYQEKDIGGLQINTGNGWVDVQAEPDTYVVNIGDLMARWTNDRWVSTLHRVVNRMGAQTTCPKRLSLVFFNQPNLNIPISVLESCISEGHPSKYPVTTPRKYFELQQGKLALKLD